MEYCNALFEFLLICASHKNKKISSNTFEFWNFFRRELLIENVLQHIRNNNYSFVAEAYLALFKVITEKCKARSVKVVPIHEARTTGISNVNKEESGKSH